ncbi:MAG: histidinol phosphate phosphatase domain-containing protein [Candidatus Omnitrophota bacterium]
MFDLHTHSLLSDGALLPSELARHYEVKGFRAIAITDHTDASNIKTVISSILEFTRTFPKASKIKIIPGIELTHLPLVQFKPLVRYARAQGIKLIIGHGETLVEPVIPGTNRAALLAGVDILAHPGLIKASDVELAAKKNIYLEISCRRGHCLTNGHVATLAKRFKAKLIINTDSHSPEDILSPRDMILIAQGAGLDKKQSEALIKNAQALLSRIV